MMKMVLNLGIVIGLKDNLKSIIIIIIKVHFLVGFFLLKYTFFVFPKTTYLIMPRKILIFIFY